MMPLTLVDVDEDNIIKKIGGKPEVKKHLENLGFVVGGHVKIISKLGGSCNQQRTGTKNYDLIKGRYSENENT